MENIELWKRKRPDIATKLRITEIYLRGELSKRELAAKFGLYIIDQRWVSNHKTLQDENNHYLKGISKLCTISSTGIDFISVVQVDAEQWSSTKHSNFVVSSNKIR